MSGDLVSVLVPCYRQAHYLRQCVASLQAQTHPRWEAIVINDGSPDDTREVAQRLCAEDPRVRYRETANAGVSSARNLALDMAQGEFVQFLDADDLLPTDKLAAGVSVMAAQPAVALVYGDYVFQDDAGRTWTNDFTSPAFEFEDPLLDLALRWEVEFSIPMNSFLFRRALFESPPLRFDTTLRNHVDWELWIRLFQRRPGTVKVPGVTAIYRSNPTSMTKDRRAMHRGFRVAIARRLSDPDLPPAVRQALLTKLDLTDHAYGHGIRGRVSALLEASGAHSMLPWPLQQLLWHRLQLDPAHHLRHLKRRFAKA